MRQCVAEPAIGPLEAYCQQLDSCFRTINQRNSLRRYLEGLLLPAERNKTLTALANAEPIVGAQQGHVQRLQWFLSESSWQPAVLNRQRLALLRADPVTAPHERGVLVIDEHGDRKRGSRTAHIGKQYLANLGKTETGVVSVTSLWADEDIYWPVDVVPYTPAHHFRQGKADPAFQTKPALALTLVQQAVKQGIPFQAVVADSFYGEHRAFKAGLREAGIGYVLALNPSHGWWHPVEEVGALWEAAEQAGWEGPGKPGNWQAVERPFRDGHRETWWAFEVVAGPYGPEREQRAVVATTDPATLPDLSTWYLATTLADADLADLVHLYGLRNWIEQSYRQVKHRLGWSQYQVRSDLAIRRHWTLVCCAFSFCWHDAKPEASGEVPDATDPAPHPAPGETSSPGRGKNHHLAAGAATGPRLVNAELLAAPLVARLDSTPDASGPPGPPRCPRPRLSAPDL